MPRSCVKLNPHLPALPRTPPLSSDFFLPPSPLLYLLLLRRLELGSQLVLARVLLLVSCLPAGRQLNLHKLGALVVEDGGVHAANNRSAQPRLPPAPLPSISLLALPPSPTGSTRQRAGRCAVQVRSQAGGGRGENTRGESRRECVDEEEQAETKKHQHSQQQDEQKSYRCLRTSIALRAAAFPSRSRTFTFTSGLWIEKLVASRMS
eukprot:752125-Hanusia_phi.AAC.1